MFIASALELDKGSFKIWRVNFGFENQYVKIEDFHFQLSTSGWKN